MSYAQTRHVRVHYACMGGNPRVVELLLSKGVNVDDQAQDGTRPLHWAYRAGNPEICKLLVAAGANPNLQWPTTESRNQKLDDLLRDIQSHKQNSNN